MVVLGDVKPGQAYYYANIKTTHAYNSRLRLKSITITTMNHDFGSIVSGQIGDNKPSTSLMFSSNNSALEILYGFQITDLASLNMLNTHLNTYYPIV